MKLRGNLGDYSFESQPISLSESMSFRNNPLSEINNISKLTYHHEKSAILNKNSFLQTGENANHYKINYPTTNTTQPSFSRQNWIQDTDKTLEISQEQKTENKKNEGKIAEIKKKYENRQQKSANQNASILASHSNGKIKKEIDLFEDTKIIKQPISEFNISNQGQISSVELKEYPRYIKSAANRQRLQNQIRKQPRSELEHNRMTLNAMRGELQSKLRDLSTHTKKNELATPKPLKEEQQIYLEKPSSYEQILNKYANYAGTNGKLRQKQKTNNQILSKNNLIKPRIQMRQASIRTPQNLNFSASNSYKYEPISNQLEMGQNKNQADTMLRFRQKKEQIIDYTNIYAKQKRYQQFNKDNTQLKEKIINEGEQQSRNEISKYISKYSKPLENNTKDINRNESNCLNFKVQDKLQSYKDILNKNEERQTDAKLISQKIKNQQRIQMNALANQQQRDTKKLLMINKDINSSFKAESQSNIEKYRIEVKQKIDIIRGSKNKKGFEKEANVKLSKEIERIDRKIKEFENNKKELNIPFKPYDGTRSLPKTTEARLKQLEENKLHNRKLSYLEIQNNRSITPSKVGETKKETQIKFKVQESPGINLKWRQNVTPMDNRNASGVNDRKRVIHDKITTSGNLKKLVKQFCTQSNLDQKFRNNKIWFSSDSRQQKWNQLKRELKLNQLNLSQTQMKDEFAVLQTQHNPFFSLTDNKCDIHSLVRSYIDCQKHWKQYIVGKFKRSTLENQGLCANKFDLDRKGYILIQDLVRFLNIESGAFLRNRDVSLILRRLQKKQQSITYETLLSIVTEK